MFHQSTPPLRETYTAYARVSFVLLGLFLLFPACSGPTLSENGVTFCQLNSDCADGLTCRFGVCEIIQECPAEEVNKECTLEGKKPPCNKGTQICRFGAIVCISNNSLSPEICDGIDNNCDGQVDEHKQCTCKVGDLRGCYTGSGGCKAQNQSYACTAPCRSGTESCCDPTKGKCTDGEWSGTCEGEVTPQTETCNGKDDNCDGKVDEIAGCECTNGQTQRCGSNEGICQQGTMTCTNFKWGDCQGEIKPQAEVCNGKDDNCDGRVDENPPCECQINQQQQCYTGTVGCTKDTSGSYNCNTPCGVGTQTCSAGKWGTCQGEQLPQTETCNNKDDDCDGTVDNVPNCNCSCSSGTCQCIDCQVDSDCQANETCQQNKCVSNVTLVLFQNATRYSDGTSASSCKEYLDGKAGYPKATQNGAYWITANGKTFRSQCRINIDGGGWTLILKVDGSKSTFQYNKPIWTDGKTLNPTSFSLNLEEAKNDAFMHVSFKEVMVYFRDLPTYSSYGKVTFGLTASSMHSVISTNNYKAFDTPVGRSGWVGALNILKGVTASLQANCNREGINVRPNTSTEGVRIGIVGNEQNDCSTPDSYIGVGGTQNESNTEPTAGNLSKYGSSNGDQKTATFAFVYIR